MDTTRWGTVGALVLFGHLRRFCDTLRLVTRGSSVLELARVL